MTSAYNKRPARRGKVRESNKTAAAFVEWVQPKNVAAKMLLTVLGIIPLVVLSFFNWVTIGGGELGVEETIGISKLSMFTSLDEMCETVSSIAYPLSVNPTELQLATAAEFESWLSGFKTVFLFAAGLLVLSIVLLVLSVFFAKTKARNPFAYAGFIAGVASPALFYYAVSSVNRTAGSPVMEITLFPFLALIAAIVGMVYCIRYPVATNARGKRNSAFTRFVTSFFPVKGDGTVEGIRKVIFTSALASFIFFASTLGVDLFNVWRANQIQKNQETKAQEIVELKPEEEEKFKEEKPRYYLSVWRENHDVVGWVKLGDTKINYSVLQTDNNSYYLDYDFEHKASSGGWIFADYRNRLRGTDISDNTILYGHNIRTGDYFAALSNYLRKKEDLSYYKQYPVINFDTMYEKAEWKIFAATFMNTLPEWGDVFAYWDKHEFSDMDDFNDYILNVMDRSVLFTDVDLEYGDKLLTLSTCYWPMGQEVDTRVVIFARKVRPGESSEVDVEKAKYNSKVLRFAKEIEVYGNTWTGRVWDAETYLKGYKGE